MAGRYQQLRLEMQANFELTWAGQADSNKRIEGMATRLERQADKIEEHGTKIAEQGSRIAEQGRQIKAGLKETARLGREVVAIGHQMAGRFRLMSDRFGKFLDVLESEATEQTLAIADLDARVTRLEQDRGPAA